MADKGIQWPETAAPPPPRLGTKAGRGVKGEDPGARECVNVYVLPAQADELQRILGRGRRAHELDADALLALVRLVWAEHRVEAKRAILAATGGRATWPV